MAAHLVVLVAAWNIAESSLCVKLEGLDTRNTCVAFIDASWSIGLAFVAVGIEEVSLLAGRTEFGVGLALMRSIAETIRVFLEALSVDQEVVLVAAGAKVIVEVHGLAVGDDLLAPALNKSVS